MVTFFAYGAGECRSLTDLQAYGLLETMGAAPESPGMWPNETLPAVRRRLIILANAGGRCREEAAEILEVVKVAHDRGADVVWG